ncbi:PREDICTED: malignant fibrous histiocytoma-amplified sequence 1 homolog [Branchiostoma belcheri]|uniref:Malignant fibrous histiocytoma-amplified sequence 1 homolog n=1 Tax=Branchiostoma belcheri TaxID=7741 RepID=A0A6P5A711_BRABE|nr:PREDICTED: malignant fibrous histiocytoma-amplified sequence 1 homolog [Branchiostoma belcheri]
MGVAICLHYAVKKYQNRETKENDQGPESGQVDKEISPAENDHESTFLFHPEQYKDHVDVEHIKLTKNDPVHESGQVDKEISPAENDHESTFLFHQEQYKDHVDVEHIQLTKQPEEDQSLTIFEEINQFKRLKTVTIIGLKLDDTSLSNLFQCTSIRSLKISNCQLASIPRSLANLKDLEILDLSRNNLTTLPARPIRSLPCLKSLNISHNKITVIRDVVKKLQALQHLDVSYNAVGEIPYEILEMENLEFFSCSHNKIARWLDPSNGERKASTCHLASLNMSSNLLAEVPQNVKELKNLSVVNLSDNKIGENIPDKILRQQISELFYLPSVSTNNELEDLPLVLCFLPSLTKLDLKQNKISSVSENVKSCKSLSVLDVSHNRLKEIPSQVIRLPELRVIDASNNQISSVSSLRKDESSVVEDVALADNCLSHFPEALIQTKSLKKVDLSNNNIKEIPETIMDMPKDVKLELKGNPIIDPPLEVCQAGLETIQAFYEDLTTASSITQCLKTLFLGTYEAGKTSLVRVFQLDRSNLTKTGERTDGIEVAELHLSAPNTSDITLSVWDFAGQETYYITHQFFLSAKALMLLVVNLEEYDSARFYSTCGNWMENMIAKVGNPVVIPVATHIDKLEPEEVEPRIAEDFDKNLESRMPDHLLLCVAKKLGAEWERLAIHMGFTKANVYKFKCDHLYNTDQQILAMLTTWRDRKGRNATRQELQRVLIEAGVDVISCL